MTMAKNYLKFPFWLFEPFPKLYLVVYSTPGSPRNSHRWQTAVTRLPSCISAKRRPTIRRIFLHLEYLALTNAASRSVAERKAGERLTSTSCCIQSTPPSLWTGQYSVVFVLEMPQCHSTWLYYISLLGKGAKNQNGNLRWHLPLGIRPPPP